MGVIDYVKNSWITILILCICILFIVLWTTIWDSDKLKQELKDVTEDNGTVNEVYIKYEKLYTDKKIIFDNEMEVSQKNTPPNEWYYKECELRTEYKKKLSKADILVKKIKDNDADRIRLLSVSSGIGAVSLAYIISNTRAKYIEQKSKKVII
jgi:hypothetical protein